jgi:phage anti-repressor protein
MKVELKKIEHNGKEWISAIEIHEKAFNNKRYSNFISDYLLNYEGVKQGIDFVIGGLQNTGKRGRPITEYFIHIDYAKEIFASVRTPQSRVYLKYLISLEKRVDNNELHSDEQVIYLIKLKEVFKYVCYQSDIEKLHQQQYVEGVKSKNPYADYHAWRNRMLNIEPEVLEQRIKEYCIEHGRNTNAKTKKDKLLFLDKYESIRNAVWDFLQIKGEVNSMRLANLVKRMAETEGTQLFRTNESDMFRKKEEINLPLLEGKSLDTVSKELNINKQRTN